MTTRCIVVPPSPTQSEPDDDSTDFHVDSNNNSNSPTTNPECESFDAEHDSCTSIIPSAESNHNYTRNRSTTRSWPVIYRNNSLSAQQHNYLEPSKTEQLQVKSESKRKSTHQYDFDQIFGLNNVNYQQYLAQCRKQSSCDVGYDKSPSIYDMQHPSQESPENQTQSGAFCSAPPTVIFLLLTLLMTTTATSMLCAAIMTDHWENVIWDKAALTKIVNESESSKVTNQLEFLLDGKVARLPFKGKSFNFPFKIKVFHKQASSRQRSMAKPLSIISLKKSFFHSLVLPLPIARLERQQKGKAKQFSVGCEASRNPIVK